jgi:hypothetical protein
LIYILFISSFSFATSVAWQKALIKQEPSMTRFLPNFFAKKAAIQVNDLETQAQAALQLRVSRMMQHATVSASPQIVRAA